jgi:dTDP-glucose pyrophosphorylase
MINWKNLLISPDASIEDAISTIDRGGARIALVVDGEGKLLGTVTDGDIRRALIGHKPLTESISQVMNASPRSATRAMDRQKILALMSQHRVLQMPVVDERHHVIGIEMFDVGISEQRQDNWVLLLAGGFGTRLRPLTDSCPKPMLDVGGKPILQSIIESFINLGFHRFCVSVHYMADVIKSHFGSGEGWNVEIRYIDEDVPLGTAGSLSMLKDAGELPVIVMNGDLLSRVNYMDLLKFHAEHGAVATVCAREYTYQVPFGVIDFAGYEVRRIVEKPVQKCFVSAGIYVISPDVVAGMERGKAIDMPDLLQGLIDRNRIVCTFPIHEYWLDIGRFSDYERANREFQD